MNQTYNDYGKLVYQIGMIGSDADIKNRFPKALSRIKSYYNHYSYAEAFCLIAEYINRLNFDTFTKKRIIEVSGLHMYYSFSFD